MKKYSTFFGPIAVFFVCLSIIVFSFQSSYAADLESEPTGKALNYLAFNQLENGAIHEQGDLSPRYDLTSWTAISFASAGFNPSNVKTSRASSSLTDYLVSNACEQKEILSVERSIIALKSFNYDLNLLPCDLVEKLDRAVLADGSVNSDIIASVFGLIAYKAAGQMPPPETVNYVLSKQDSDGGFEPYAPWGTESTFTAQTVQALIGAGVSPTNLQILKGRQYLKNLQTNSGGFKYQAYSLDSNSGSSSAVLMAIYALNENPESLFWLKNGKSAIDDLLRLQKDNGSFLYDLDPSWGDATPVFSTSYGGTVMALNHQFLPISTTGLRDFAQKSSALDSPSPTPVISPVIATNTNIEPQTALADNGPEKDAPLRSGAPSVISSPIASALSEVISQKIPPDQGTVYGTSSSSVRSGSNKNFSVVRLFYAVIAFGGAFLILYFIGRLKYD